MAEFAYDALGRRIRKRDCIADTNNIYYYNDNWQVLCDYNDSGVLQHWFAYGNYIDEALITGKSYSWTYFRYYVHDHLYSPVALTNHTGTVQERYEYDAYGNCYILEPNFAPDPDGKSDYGNPYLFTGRRVDILDNGSLTIQYNRNRYYDQYTGRWLTHDPLGITPNPSRPNKFRPIGQYKQGESFYGYVRSEPIRNADAYGLFRGRESWISVIPCGKCGMKFPTSEFKSLEDQLKKQLIEAISKAPPGSSDYICEGMYHWRGWDWSGIHDIERYQPDECGCGSPALKCKATVEINGKCYNAHELNYYLWGVANRLCGHSKKRAMRAARLWTVFRPDRSYCKVRWAEAGYDGKVSIAGCTVSKCKPGKCRFWHRGTIPYVRRISPYMPYIGIRKIIIGF